ncbi:MAG: sugar ABC transporter ATP-binding protein [Candidatus Caldatribacterium sp.]|uniref:sugar ABC transporter ATP-binding protein n=1 Tax=Candidatus Caldatribacterium sp. TaxID=2282143 RepID=UPI00299AE3B0|nr:sugar ABC transporter ATP-binding protein [Candidatus Caldatribacterium sp.]MCX7730427.1 sugar ABC transporter ATP-binding protein [Candidatus Caldatribacterium sp.]MDW8081257.1 sugar ABC transporter ATP-binding protein [Candidatus Calescibacterium sp.]
MVMSFPVLSVRDVSKSFPGVRALNKVSMDVLPGEVHALLGENGAGKSTLMKIISGIIPKDSGEILLDGRPVHFFSPRDALNAGVALVQQELSLVPYLSIAENIFLGRWPKRGVQVDWGAIVSATRRLLERFGIQEDPRTPVGSLSVAEQQMVEILKAISRPNVRLLLLDEPTSALSEDEVHRLFELISEIKKTGIGIIFISHKLNEALRIADRITVLRDGQKVITEEACRLDERMLFEYLTGKPVAFTEIAHDGDHADAAFALSLEGFSVGGFVRDVTLKIRKGEVFVLFGLVGSGRSTLARGLFGLEHAEGKMMLGERVVRPRSPQEAIALGIGYLPEDRRNALVYELPVFANITLAVLSLVSRRGILRIREETRLAEDFVRSLRIKTPTVFREVLYLSGGNQQKVLLARWLARKPKLLIMDEPTRGIDVGAKFEIREMVRNLARQGLTVLYITSEPVEAIEVADRIAVMRNGRIIRIFDRPKEVDKTTLLAVASGVS